MKKYAYLIVSLSILLVFIVFTILVKTVDVQYLSHNNTYLGFYTLNTNFGNWVTNSFKRYHSMQKLSDILFYISIGYSGLMGIFGIISWIRHKKLKLVNKQYFVLLGAYITVVFLYFVFEVVKINYSPESSLEKLKASYPSSHVFMGCSFLLLNSYAAVKLLNLEKKWLIYPMYIGTGFVCILLTASRLLSAKHWLTDVIAAAVLAGVVYFMFIFASHQFNKVNEEEKAEEVEQQN